MTKRQRQLLSSIAHEAHIMGRVYNQLGEPETPSVVYDKVEEMVEAKIIEFKFKPYEEKHETI